jgi:hypothetical protein
VKASSGVIVSADVDTDAALEALEFPVDAMVACAAVRTALFEAALAPDAAALAARLTGASDTTLFDGETALLDKANVGLAAEASTDERDGLTAGTEATEAGAVARDVSGVTEPALSCVVCEPLAGAPEVLTHIRRNIEGRARNCGATSMTT